MKQKYWKIRNILSQILILVFLGGILYWIGKNIYGLNLIQELTLIKYLFFFCIFLFVLLCFISISALISNHISKPYNPADPDSLAQLAKEKKYMLDPSLSSGMKHGESLVPLIIEWLNSLGYKQIARHKIGLIFERKTNFLTYRFKEKYHRTFLLYRPLLNVLIIDNILSETVNLIVSQNQYKAVSQNNLILITDMKNEEEVLSAGAGIVNYVSTEQTSFLNPIFIDLNHARLFYPQDNSLLPVHKKLAQSLKRRKMLSWLRHKLG